MSALFLPIDFTHESPIDVVVNILAHFLKKKWIDKSKTLFLD